MGRRDHAGTEQLRGAALSRGAPRVLPTSTCAPAIMTPFVDNPSPDVEQVVQPQHMGRVDAWVDAPDDHHVAAGVDGQVRDKSIGSELRVARSTAMLLARSTSTLPTGRCARAIRATAAASHGCAHRSLRGGRRPRQPVGCRWSRLRASSSSTSSSKSKLAARVRQSYGFLLDGTPLALPSPPGGMRDSARALVTRRL